MTDFASTTLTQQILWSIRNYSTSGVKNYASSCFGLHWKFEFVPYLVDSNRSHIAIFLECLNLSESNSTMKCSFSTYILSVDGSKQYGAKLTKITLKDKRWIIWWNCIDDLHLPGQDIHFCIQISLSGEIENQITCREKMRKQAKEEKDICLTSLREDIASLYDNCELSDFELRCKEWTKPVHKAVLSTRCGYFAALFRSHMKETDKSYVEFHDIKPHILQHVIHYLYAGKLPDLHLDSVRQVYAVADRFDFGSLRVKCASLVMDNFVKDHQSNTKSDDLNQEAGNLHDSNLSSTESGTSNQHESKLLDSDQSNAKNDTLNQEAGKLNESNMSNTKNDTLTQDTANVHDSHEDKSKTLLRQLFRTSEWLVLFEEYPALAEKMCKPIILDVPKI